MRQRRHHLQMPDMKKLQEDREARTVHHAMQEHIQLLYAQAAQFELNYVTYKMLELARLKAGDSEYFTAHESKEENDKCKANQAVFKEQMALEARKIFYTAEQQRRKGQDVMSREALLEYSQELKEASEAKRKESDKKKKKEPVKDEQLCKIIGKEPAKEDEVKTLMQACDSMNAYDRYDAEVRDIARREKELGGQTEDLFEEEKKLNNTKEVVGIATQGKVNLADPRGRSSGGRS